MTLLASRGRGIADRLDALDQVLALARDRVDPAVVAQAERVASKASDRLRFGEAHTVVALAGTTGSGKSSLFNSLVGEELSLVGLRRPTTGVAHAAVWGEADASRLLDWLEVPRRHLLSDPADPADPALDGLVLLDLPDVDSVEQRNRIEAERLVERVDLLVWVLDPQKYADATVHDRYLAPLAGHAEVMLIVLNQIDRLPPRAQEGCLADLRGLLRADGLQHAAVVPVSARTGEGLDDLRAELTSRAAAKRTAVRRLEADLSALAAAVDDSCAGTAARGVGRAERETLVTSLSRAAGADVVSAAVARTHQLRARQATGWPLTRWTSRLRRDPARRLHLRDSPSELVRTALPGPSAVQRARVDAALREVGDHASQGLSDPWPSVVRAAVMRSRASLPDLLDRAVSGTDLGLGRRPRWWRLASLLQLLLVATAAIGLLWLMALFAVEWLQLPPPPLPRWGRIPVPTVMLAGGLLLGLVLGVLFGLVSKAGASRRARQVRRRLHDRVDQVAQDAVIGPVEQELAAHRDLGQALARVRG